jgi:hypothetical protein
VTGFQATSVGLTASREHARPNGPLQLVPKALFAETLGSAKSVWGAPFANKPSKPTMCFACKVPTSPIVGGLVRNEQSSKTLSLTVENQRFKARRAKTLKKSMPYQALYRPTVEIFHE